MASPRKNHFSESQKLEERTKSLRKNWKKNLAKFPMFCTDRASYFIQSKKFKNVDFIDFIDNHQTKIAHSTSRVCSKFYNLISSFTYYILRKIERAFQKIPEKLLI